MVRETAPLVSFAVEQQLDLLHLATGRILQPRKACPTHARGAKRSTWQPRLAGSDTDELFPLVVHGYVAI